MVRFCDFCVCVFYVLFHLHLHTIKQHEEPVMWLATQPLALSPEYDQGLYTVYCGSYRTVTIIGL